MKNIYKNLKRKVMNNINNLHLINLSLAMNFTNSVKDSFRVLRKHYHSEINLKNKIKIYFFKLFFISIKSRKKVLIKNLIEQSDLKGKYSRFILKKKCILKEKFIRTITSSIHKNSRYKQLRNIYLKYVKVHILLK